MGIADKLGHAAEELKEKGQDAMHKVTGKHDGHEGSTSTEQPTDYPRDTGGHTPATGASGDSPQTWDADSAPTGTSAPSGSSGSASDEWRPAVGGDATPNSDVPNSDVERRDPNTDPMRIPPPTKAANQDNVGKVNYLQ